MDGLENHQVEMQFKDVKYQEKDDIVCTKNRNIR